MDHLLQYDLELFFRLKIHHCAIIGIDAPRQNDHRGELFLIGRQGYRFVMTSHQNACL